MEDTRKYFLPPNSPIANRQTIKSSFDFDSQQERNSVDLTKIKNFSFSSGQGGTLTLGGTANGNGYFQIKDSSGSVIVIGDNTGLTVNNGSITINSSDGSVVIDSKGLYSLSQFVNAQLSNNTPQTTSGTAWATANGSSFTVTATRDVKVLFNLLVTAKSNNEEYAFNQRGVDSRLYDDYLGGAAIDNATIYGYSATRADISGGSLTGFTYFSDVSPESISVILQVAAGTHNYNIQFRPYNGGTAVIGAYSVSILVLGK